MAWLKYTPVFKWGMGGVGYTEIHDIDALEDIKSDVWGMHGDPEGIREPIWEVLNVLPQKVLMQKIVSLRARISDMDATLDRYNGMLYGREFS